MDRNTTGRSDGEDLIATARAVTTTPCFRYRYSICTFVTNWNDYAQMLASFRRGGFTLPNSEFLYIDNSAANQCDAFRGGNALLTAARGCYIILCHQDVVLLEDGLNQLEHCVEEIDRLDPNWAVLGNAGGVCLGRKAIRITDPFGTINTGQFPIQVASLDENFLLLKKQAGLRFSVDLSGFHLYGTDICQVAAFYGYRSYVVDFHLHHRGGKKFEEPLQAERQMFIRKYQAALRARYVQTTCTQVYLSGSHFGSLLFNTKHGRSIYKRVQWLKSLLRRTPSSSQRTRVIK